ncbi:hypothetical protein OG539_19405 [Actinacidiphila glaucinigra]|uniref:hypothetical protein n=1 Tax=Actinacidiphila glaucinigra TaxID=235986 RepID=UPI0032566E75
MDNLIICIPTGVQPADLVEPLSAIGEVGLHPDAVTVGKGVNGFSLWLDKDHEFEQEELARIAELLGPYTGLFLPYRHRDMDVAKRIARAIAERFPCVVDTDWSFFGSGEEFLARLDADPDWDWWQDEEG